MAETRVSMDVSQEKEVKLHLIKIICLISTPTMFSDHNMKIIILDVNHTRITKNYSVTE